MPIAHEKREFTIDGETLTLVTEADLAETFRFPLQQSWRQALRRNGTVDIDVLARRVVEHFGNRRLLVLKRPGFGWDSGPANVPEPVLPRRE
jgi:hypothetical protein